MENSAMDSPPGSGHEDGSSSAASSLMENMMGLLRVKIIKGVNLAVRDVRSSDPYIVVKMGKQKLKTRVIKKDVNPVWNEDLTLSVVDPTLPLQMRVYDHDRFSKDDAMGEADIDLTSFIDSLKMNLEEFPNGTVISKITPSRQNCLAEESQIMWDNGSLIQDMCIRLKNVECGEIELQLMWIDLPGSKTQ